MDLYTRRKNVFVYVYWVYSKAVKGSFASLENFLLLDLMFMELYWIATKLT